jgi:MYXO-CTERM domain-containing protein
MRTASLLRSVTLASLLLATTAARAQVELKNDSFVDGQTAGFQGGFVAGELGAARFIPAGPCTITKIQLFFGGQSTATKTVTVHIYDDSAGTNSPGSELMTATDVQMTGSDSALQEVDLTTLGQITASGPFRVGIEFQHAGYPSIARDNDGNTYPDRNWIYTSSGWFKSQALGVQGDWIIRAFVVYSGDVDGGTQEDAGVTQEDAAPQQHDAATQQDGGNQSCQGNTDCPGGQYCGANNVCTYDCLTNDDCTGANSTCNSLGKCVDKGDSGCGCVAPGARPTGGALALTLVGLALVLLRRRRQP